MEGSHLRPYLKGIEPVTRQRLVARMAEGYLLPEAVMQQLISSPEDGDVASPSRRLASPGRRPKSSPQRRGAARASVREADVQDAATRWAISSQRLSGGLSAARASVREAQPASEEPPVCSAGLDEHGPIVQSFSIYGGFGRKTDSADPSEPLSLDDGQRSELKKLKERAQPTPRAPPTPPSPQTGSHSASPRQPVAPPTTPSTPHPRPTTAGPSVQRRRAALRGDGDRAAIAEAAARVEAVQATAEAAQAVATCAEQHRQARARAIAEARCFDAVRSSEHAARQRRVLEWAAQQPHSPSLRNVAGLEKLRTVQLTDNLVEREYALREMLRQRAEQALEDEERRRAEAQDRAWAHGMKLFSAEQAEQAFLGAAEKGMREQGERHREVAARAALVLTVTRDEHEALKEARAPTVSRSPSICP